MLNGKKSILLSDIGNYSSISPLHTGGSRYKNERGTKTKDSRKAQKFSTKMFVVILQRKLLSHALCVRSLVKKQLQTFGILRWTR